jgi:hypothetical protein
MILRWVRSPVAPKMTAAMGASFGCLLEIMGGQEGSGMTMDITNFFLGKTVACGVNQAL